MTNGAKFIIDYKPLEIKYISTNGGYMLVSLSSNDVVLFPLSWWCAIYSDK